MKRLQLFEFEDLPWFPRVWRDGVTDFLQFAVSRGDIYRRFAPRLASALERSKARQVVDLCAGGGGPWQELQASLPPVAEGRVPVLLTDYYPNQAKFEAVSGASGGRITYRTVPVSALDVDGSLHGFRTLFSSFHHFDPDSARAIIADAISKGHGIAIAESTQRHPLMLLYMLFTPLLVMVATPLIRPFRWSRLVFTYLLPVIPLTVMFDGIVSCLRTYTPEELEQLVAQAPGHGAFTWEAGVERMGPLPVGVTYLIGVPRSS